MKFGFVIHHNGPPANCVGQGHLRCERFWQAVKDFHVNSNGWSDIAYSFGVCPHGVLFTGRGWLKNQFANGEDVVGIDDGDDSDWYTVLVFLGGDEKPTEAMVAGVRKLIQDGRAYGRCGMRVLPHNAFKVKACPGPEFTAYANAWDNTTIGEWDEMATVEEVKAAVRSVLNEGTGNGQVSWASTSKAVLATVQGNKNSLGQLLAREVVADVDEQELAAAIVAAMPPENAQAVADAILASIKERL